MKAQKLQLGLLLALFVMTCTSPVQAQLTPNQIVDPNPNKTQPPQQKPELPDGIKPEDLVRGQEKPEKNEVSRNVVLVKPDGWVLERVILFEPNQDLTARVQKFRTAPDSGHTLEQEITVAQKPSVTVVTTKYRVDGKAVHTVDTVDKAGSRSKYFAPDGKQLFRQRTQDGQMYVTVSDAKNTKLYLQKWLFASSNTWNLSTVVEYTGGVATRRIFVSDKKVDHVEILNADGSVKATEAADKISQPVDPVRLGELDAADDLTVPPVPTTVSTPPNPYGLPG